eukprot:ANDGO_01952.mRNA.1 Putative SET domain-containing protein L678
MSFSGRKCCPRFESPPENALLFMDDSLPKLHELMSISFRDLASQPNVAATGRKIVGCVASDLDVRSNEAECLFTLSPTESVRLRFCFVGFPVDCIRRGDELTIINPVAAQVYGSSSACLVCSDCRCVLNVTRAASFSANDWKDLGNAYFRRTQIYEAILCYSYGIRCDAQNVACFANRAECFLRIRCWERALHDSNRVLELDPSHAKGRNRRDLALASLGRHAELSESFDAASRQRVKDESEGIFRSPIRDLDPHPTYFCSSMLRFQRCTDTQKGSGVYATCDIPAGTLLLVENPFACASDTELGLDELDYLRRTQGEKTRLLFSPRTLLLKAKLWQRLTVDPESFESVKWMRGLESKHAEELRMSDMDDWIKYNAFEGASVAGMYPLAAQWNHSCLPNCVWYIDTSVLVMVSCANIKATEECCDGYFHYASFDERQRTSRSMGFVCRCSRCALESTIPRPHARHAFLDASNMHHLSDADYVRLNMAQLSEFGLVDSRNVFRFFQSSSHLGRLLHAAEGCQSEATLAVLKDAERAVHQIQSWFPQ